MIDAENEIATDEDWYVYERTDCTVDESLIAEISIPDNSPFINHLELRFYHQDGTSEGKKGNLVSTPFKRCEYHFPPNASRVYFRISPIGVVESIGIGSYKIRLHIK